MAKWWIHNLIAHPLLVLCPPLGEWLHDRTIDEPHELSTDAEGRILFPGER